MHPQLATIVSQFEAAQTRLHRLASATPDDRWAARANPAKWSVGECVAHLNLTSHAYVPLLRAALDEARAVAGTARQRYRRDAVGWLIAIMSGPMPGFGSFRFGRVRTAPKFVPEGDLPREQVVAEFDALQAEQISLTKQADGLPLDRVRVVSPFNESIRYNIYACLTILPGHQHRHLWQAEQVWAA